MNQQQMFLEPQSKELEDFETLILEAYQWKNRQPSQQQISCIKQIRNKRWQQKNKVYINYDQSYAFLGPLQDCIILFFVMDEQVLYFQNCVMGNSQKSRIIILYDKSTSRNFFEFLKMQQVTFVLYDDFSNFISKQNPKQIKDIIVAYSDPKQDEEADELQKTVAMFILQEKLYSKPKKFTDVCPFLATKGLSSMKDKLIDYIKKYSLQINIYLFVEEYRVIRLMHYQKPYIKIVSSNIEYIVNCIVNSDIKPQKLEQKQKSYRMFEGFYRKVIVKVIDKFYNYPQSKKSQKKQPESEPQPQKQEPPKQSKPQQPLALPLKKSESTLNKLNNLMKQRILQKNQFSEEQIKINKDRIERERKILEDANVLPQYFGDLQKFQKSFISTLCEYVICDEEYLMDVIDIMKKCQLQYKIILRADPDKKIETAIKNYSLDDKNKLAVWQRNNDFNSILKKISNFTEISKEEAPQISMNVIICGNDQIFVNHIQKIKNDVEKHIKKLMVNQIKRNTSYFRQITAQGQKKFNALSEVKKQEMIQAEMKKDQAAFLESLERQYEKIDNESKTKFQDKQLILQKRTEQERKKAQLKCIQFFAQSSMEQIAKMKLKNETYISFIKEQQFDEKLLKQLKKTIYSYIVVFKQDSLVTKIKKILRQNNFHQRVQLTSIESDLPHHGQLPKKNTSKKPKQKTQQQIKKILQQKLAYLQKKVPYQIKFEIMPLVSIHLFNPSENVKNFFSRKIGLKIKIIKNISQFKSKYIIPHFQEIVQSRLLVCSVDDYKRYIFDVLTQYAGYQNSGVYKLKIIIFDQEKQKIIQLSKEQKYFHSNIQYIDFHKERVQNFVLHCKAPNVSIPFFRPGTLSQFEARRKQVQSFRSSFSLNLQSSVFSSNQIIRDVLGDTLGLNTCYDFGMLGFDSTSISPVQQILKYEQYYIKSYIDLWHFDFDFISGFSKKQTPSGKQKKETKGKQKDGSAQQNQVNLQILKEQICFLFYKCKSYYLLNVSDRDFQEFYIDRINECRDLLDLQSACIYVLSLPHGFNNVISDLFKSPSRSKLVIKIFVVYMIILLTAFYNIGAEQENTASLTAYLDHSKGDNKQIKILKEGNIVFTNDFVFCVDSKKNISDKDNIKAHQITFKFDSIAVLEKSKIKAYMNIEKYSFYKEGAEYIISPFTKFVVSSVKINRNGYYEIQLKDASNRLSSFPFRMLKENNISQEEIHSIIKLEKQSGGKTMKMQKGLPLHKRTQIVNIIKNKEEIIEQFRKGENYNLFFQAKNKRMYLSAFMYLNLEKRNIESAHDKLSTTVKKSKQSEQYKAIGIERAYVYYQMNQYLNSINDLKKVQKVLDLEAVNEKEEWKKKKVQNIIKSVQKTYQHRIEQIFSFPKRKFWKVTFIKSQDGETKDKKPGEFKVQRRKQNWQVNYNSQLQIFSLKYGSKLEKNQMKKILEQNSILAENPPNQFGKLTIQRDLKIFDYVTRINNKIQQGELRNNTMPQTEITQISEQQIEQGQQQAPGSINILQQIIQNPTRRKEWRVFFRNKVPIVAAKNKHYHTRPINCTHNHSHDEGQNNYHGDTQIKKYDVPNDTKVTDLFLLNDEAQLNDRNPIGFSVD